MLRRESDGTYRPVGLCAIVNAIQRRPKAVIALDSVQDRLDRARSLGAESFDHQTQRTDAVSRIKTLTEERGADAVIGLATHDSNKLQMLIFADRSSRIVTSTADRVRSLTTVWISFFYWRP